VEVIKYEQRPYEWFAEKVGKKIYREGDKTAITIKDLAHAGFLCDGQSDFKYKYSEEK
jgi:hypothetical protein